MASTKTYALASGSVEAAHFLGGQFLHLLTSNQRRPTSANTTF
jgi:hypothetical protein